MIENRTQLALIKMKESWDQNMVVSFGELWEVLCALAQVPPGGVVVNAEKPNEWVTCAAFNELYPEIGSRSYATGFCKHAFKSRLDWIDYDYQKNRYMFRHRDMLKYMKNHIENYACLTVASKERLNHIVTYLNY